MINYDFRGRLQYIPGGALNVQMSAWPATTSAYKTNLVSWWALDETSGTRYDAHGSNDLTDVNTVGYGTGKVSNGADFVAANVEYFTVDSNSTLQTGGTDFTVTLWFYTHAIAINNSYLISKVATSNLEFQLTIRYVDNLLRFVLWDAGTTAKALNSSVAISINTWYFAAIRWNNTTKLQEVIINAGTPTTATQTGAAITSGTAPFRIANSAGGVAPIDSTVNHDGLIDEVAFWKRVLTNDEVSWLYNAGNGRAYSEL